MHGVRDTLAVDVGSHCTNAFQMAPHPRGVPAFKLLLTRCSQRGLARALVVQHVQQIESATPACLVLSG